MHRALNSENLELLKPKEVVLPKGHVSNQDGYDGQMAISTQEVVQPAEVDPIERTSLSVEAVQDCLRPGSNEKSGGLVLAAIMRFRDN